MAKIETITPDKAVHCMGNGELCVSAVGLNLLEVFGPPYSSVTLFALESADQTLTHDCKRVESAAIWEHTLLRNGRTIGTLCEFVDAELPCYVRRMELQEAVSFTLHLIPSAMSCLNGRRFGLAETGALLLQHDAGIYVYGHYPSPRPLCYQLVVQGNATLTFEDGETCILHCEAGESMFLAIGAEDIPALTRHTEQLLPMPFAALRERTLTHWQAYRREGYSAAQLVPQGAPHREELLQALDDVSVLMKVQQGSSGGVICGSVFHWAALRDQYGVSRSFLAQGHLREAAAILRYYWDIFKQRGILHNGQDIGLNGFFHIHENDEVEITGYLVLQAFDYLRTAEDEALVLEIMPMLLWAFEAQKKHLVRDMLPFNGDETYIAGGVLPRCTLNDGSAEATLLFWTGGVLLLDFAVQHRIWSSEQVEENRTLLARVEKSYDQNFVEGTRLRTNNPLRKKDIALPQFRHGVCEGCLAPPFYTFGWTEKNENDRYLCPVCMTQDTMPRAEDTVYFVSSVSLAPLFLRSTLLKRNEIEAMVEDIAQQYCRTGYLSSRPGSDVTVGYDYGLLLYSLTELQHPLAGEIYACMLALRDERGAWAEYYHNNTPAGTRCRPWESGINLLAALHYVACLANNEI